LTTAEDQNDDEQAASLYVLLFTLPQASIIDLLQLLVGRDGVRLLVQAGVLSDVWGEAGYRLKLDNTAED